MSEETLTPLNRPPDRDPVRSTAREQCAQALERLAARVRADDGEKRFAAWSQETQALDLPDPARRPSDPSNAMLTVVRITWRKE